MDNRYKTLESVIKDMTSAPMLEGVDWRYSRLCNTIRNMYEKVKETRQEADKEGFDDQNLRLKNDSDKEKIELRRNKKSQEKLKIIDSEGN